MKSIESSEFVKLSSEEMNYVQGGDGTTKTKVKSYNDDGALIDKHVTWEEDAPQMM